MKYQPKDSPLCGPTSVQNALRLYRKKYSLRKIMKPLPAEVHKEGAHQFQLMVALHELGFEGRPFNLNDRKAARAKLEEGYPTILCVHTDNPWDHWVCVQHLHHLGSYLLLDSENAPKNKAENGIHVLTWLGIQRLWMAPARAQTDISDRNYYGIQVLPAPTPSSSSRNL